MVSKLDEQVIAPLRDDIPFPGSAFCVPSSELNRFYSELRGLNAELKTANLSPRVVEASVVSKLDEQAVLGTRGDILFAVPSSEF